MRWKKCLRLSLPAFCCLASLQLTFAFAASTTKPESVEATTKAGIPVDQKWKYPRPCYVEKSKVEELIVQMNSTVRILNRGDGNLQCQEKLGIKLVDADDINICSEERIQRIQKDLFKVAGSLFQHAIRLTEPSEEEVDFLDLIKFQLVKDLEALRVFYGSLPCESYSIALFPFQRLITPVKESLDQVYALFKSARRTRPPPPTSPATTPKPTIDDMLDPEKSFAVLTQMAKSNPSLMSRALPKIVSQRYSRRASTFDSLLDFVNAMPTSEKKIIGFSAVYDEMHGHNQKPEALQLEKLAKNLRLIIASAPTTLNVVARSKLDELAEDPDLRPLIFMLSPQWSLQELAEMAQSNPSIMSTGLPEIISQRYNASDSQLEALLNFVEGLPTTENKIIGFAAVHDEMHRHNQTTNLAKLLKLAKKLKSVNEDVQASSSFSNSATELKWTNLMRDVSPLMLIGEKAECQITNVAYETHMTAGDYEWPYSAYVHQDQSSEQTLQIYPAIKNYKLVYRILIGNAPFFAYDNTNTDSSNPKYQRKTSERYVLLDLSSDLPTNAEIDWKLVNVPAKANQFRILTAKYDDFMFAHKSETGYDGYRRVLLGKKGYSDHNHIANADLWTLDCKPGNFYIPSI